MSESNIAVKISADVADLQAKLALASSALRENSTEVRKLADEYRAAGSSDAGLRAQLEQASEKAVIARASVRSLSGELGIWGKASAGAAESAEHLGKAAAHSGIEVIELGHRMASGELEHAPIILMRLVEHLGEIGPAALIGAGAVLTLGAAVGIMGAHWLEVEGAVERAQGEMVTLGTGGAHNVGLIRFLIDDLKDRFDMSTSAASKLGEAIAELRGAATNDASKVEALAGAYAKLHTDDEAVKFGAELVAALNRGGDAALEFGKKFGVIIPTFQAALGPQEKNEAVLAALKKQFGEAGLKVAEYNQEVRNTIDLGGGMASAMGMNNEPPKMTMPEKPAIETGSQSTDPLQEQKGLIDQITGAEQKHAEILREIGVLESGITAGASKFNQASLSAIADLKIELAKLHTPVETDEHEKLMASLSAELEAAKNNAGARIAITAQMAAAEKTYAGQGSAAAIAADAKVMQERRSAAEEQLRLTVSRIQGEQRAEKSNIDAQIADQQRIVAAVAQAVRQGIATQQELVEAQNSLGDLQRQKSEQQSAVAREEGQTEIEISKLSLQAKKDDLQTEFDLHKLTADEKAASARDFAVVEESLELKSVDVELAASQKSVLDFQRAADQKKIIAAQLQVNLANINKQEVADVKSQASQEMGAWKQAADEIVSVEDAMTRDIFTKRQALHVTLLQMAADLAQKEIAADLKAATMHILYSNTELAAEKTAANGGLIAHAAMELFKTADTAKGVATRDALNQSSSSSFLGQIGQQLAQWLGLETSKSGATTASNAEITTSNTATALAGRAAAVAAGFSQISIDAAVAAAGTMAAISPIPYVGPFMAPPMAATAYGITMGFASGMGAAAAEGGMLTVPSNDFLIAAHKNESVLPASIAGPMREFFTGGSWGLPFSAAAGGGSFGGGGSAAGAAGAGGMNMTFAPQVSALDARSVVALFNNPQIMSQFAKNLGRYMTMNQSARPAY